MRDNHLFDFVELSQNNKTSNDQTNCNIITIMPCIRLDESILFESPVNFSGLNRFNRQTSRSFPRYTIKIFVFFF